MGKESSRKILEFVRMGQGREEGGRLGLGCKVNKNLFTGKKNRLHYFSYPYLHCVCLIQSSTDIEITIQRGSVKTVLVF